MPEEQEDKAPVLVTGATGNTGSAVLAELGRLGTPVRAMVRRGSDADRLAHPPQELAVADFESPGSLQVALHGVQRAYLVTPSSERAEAQQIRFARIALDSGVRHLVVLSQLAAAEDSPVRFLRYHAAVERAVRELGLEYTFLRPNLYYQGLFAFGPSIAAEGRFFAPVGEARVSAVDVRDVGAVAAAALSGPEHEGRTYTLTGPAALTHAEMADGLGEALEREVSFVDVPAEQFAQALSGLLPPWQVEGLVEDYAHYAAGEAAEVSGAVEEVTGRPARDFASFARENAAAFG